MLGLSGFVIYFNIAIDKHESLIMSANGVLCAV